MSLPFNKVCDLADWRDAELVERIRWIEPDFVVRHETYPSGREHRKSWEYGQLIRGLEQLGALRPDAWIMSVAAGSERPIFALTNRVRWVFATDIYGTGDFATREAVPAMLSDPGSLAQQEFNPNHLVVQWMNALNLRHDDNTFDASFSLSSIEHFGGVEAAATAMREMARITKPGGVVMVATECVLNGADALEDPGLHIFTPAEILSLTNALEGTLALVEPVNFDAGWRESSVLPLERAVEEAAQGWSSYPHVYLSFKGRVFTSLALFFRKV